MSDDPQELRRINVSEVLPFTQLFRSFRLAIHHNKMVMALLALILTYATGRVMDLIWPATQVRMIPEAREVRTQSEPEAYVALLDTDAYRAWRERSAELIAVHEQQLLRQLDPNMDAEKRLEIVQDGETGDEIAEALEDAREDARDALADIEEKIERADDDEQSRLYDLYEDVAVFALVGPTRDLGLKQARASLKELAKPKAGKPVEKLKEIAKQAAKGKKKEAEGKEGEDKKGEDKKAAEPDKDVICTAEQAKVLEQAFKAQSVAAQYGKMQGKGIFATLLEHEMRAFHDAVWSVLQFPPNLGLGAPHGGLKGALVAGLGGIVWLFQAHWFYGVIFAAIVLLVWSLFGGAICRIAALHAARDEKITFGQAMKFSGRKLGSFFTAPLIPLALLVTIGVAVLVGGLFAAIPYVGEIFAGLFWPLALLAGFVMALVLIGGVAGSILMFPTIAVEGSDSFDALSRSFSYVYSKPWRTAFYVLVSGVYGAICFLFVRAFAHIVLNLTHMTAGLGMNIDGSSYLPETVGKLEAIWTRTALLGEGRFYGDFGQYPLGGTEAFAGFFITLWTYIVLGLVVSFVISFFFSASTLVYYLLRREVDATDIEDVYLEEYEDELAPVTTPPPAGETKPAEGAEGNEDTSAEAGEGESGDQGDESEGDQGEPGQEDKPDENHDQS